jgi:hypothetical protein
MYDYAGMLVVKLVLALGVEVANSRLLIVGGGHLGREGAARLTTLGARCWWFADDHPAATPLAALAEVPADILGTMDALVCVEHADPRQLVGPGGLIEPARLAAINPGLPIGVASGMVDDAELARYGLTVFPAGGSRFGYQRYGTGELGPRPVIDLLAAGLKTGQVMARARQSGMSPRAAARFSIETSAAQDFHGELAWL